MAPHRVLGGVAAVVLMATLAACGGAPADEGLVRAEGVQPRAVAVVEATDLDAVTAAARAFGISALAVADREGNVVLSPGSLATAFAMLAEGARGESLAGLEALLGASGDGRVEAFAALRGALAPLDGDPAAATADDLPERPILHVADQIVLDDEFEARPEYLESLAGAFDAGMQRADLGSEAGMGVLSAWIRHHTGGLIEKTAIEPDDLLRLVLQDSVLLAARWRSPFPASGTHQDAFALSDGSPVEVETMATVGSFASAGVDGWIAVRLPYTEALHADILLPPEDADPADVTDEILGRIRARLDEAEPVSIAVALPTIDTGTTKTDLLPLLPDLGLDALTCRATGVDLSGIAGAPGDLCVAQAAHQAVLEVDEEGTVAAAVTEIGVGEASAPQPPDDEIRFDRPFLFTVSHDETGWPLFLAAIRDPRH
ncbi:serpin family protein [Microbacterium rhizophilus]|uniref:serpin family protein n=1 Tax=Microbacterium rhizophilus TaxID=3138934 RepID=UPI0031E9BF0A